jgi:Fe-S oxidoreductase
MRVALFITCFNDLLFPDVGKATVAVLRRLGLEVEFPERPDLLRPDALQHRLPRGLHCRSSAGLPRRSPGSTRS